MEIITSSEGINHKDLLQNILLKRAILYKPTLLSSGQLSDFYIDCRQIYFCGEAQFLIGELFYEKLEKLEHGKEHFLAISGMAMGSIPLTIALSCAAFRRKRNLFGCAVRKEIKDHGTKAVIEGSACLSNGVRVLVVEDVVTTGSSAMQAIKVLRDSNVKVDSVISIVDREQGGKENLLRIGVQLYSIFTLKDLRNYVDCHDQATSERKIAV
jgi:orotate phosphoribosyltransferase